MEMSIGLRESGLRGDLAVNISAGSTLDTLIRALRRGADATLAPALRARRSAGETHAEQIALKMRFADVEAEDEMNRA